MPIRPIDVQVMMPKINDVAQMNQNTQNRADAFNQGIANSFQKKTEASTKEVIKTNKSEKSKINPDDNSNKKNGREGRKNKKNANSKDDESKQPGVSKAGTTIDLRI